MKLTFAMMVLAVAGISFSCQVNPPLDPETMKPSCKCCPQNYVFGHPSSCSTCGGRIEYSK